MGDCTNLYNHNKLLLQVKSLIKMIRLTEFQLTLRCQLQLSQLLLLSNYLDHRRCIIVNDGVQTHSKYYH